MPLDFFFTIELLEKPVTTVQSKNCTSQDISWRNEDMFTQKSVCEIL